MTEPVDIAWLPESQVLKVSRLSRSTLQSWIRSGLDLGVDAAYDLRALVSLVLLSATRDFLSPKEMVGAWKAVVRAGLDQRIIEAARHLQPGSRFDLIIDLSYSSLEVAIGDSELAEAVRQSGPPRPVVILDMAEPVRRAVKYFEDHANPAGRPKKKAPGRPRNAARLHIAEESR